jgi:hypothetical protein
MKDAITVETKKIIRELTILTSGIYALSVLCAVSHYKDAKSLRDLKTRGKLLVDRCSELERKLNKQVESQHYLPADEMDNPHWKGG